MHQAVELVWGVAKVLVAVFAMPAAVVAVTLAVRLVNHLCVRFKLSFGRSSQVDTTDTGKMAVFRLQTLALNTSTATNAALVCAAVLLAYILYSWLRSADESTPTVPSAAGWNDLLVCSELTSFDGNASLILSSDGRAEYQAKEKSGDSKSNVGRWSLVNDKMRLYSLSIDKVIPGPYFIVSPETAEGCVFAFGRSITNVDLRRSWFSAATDEPDPADYGEPPGGFP